MEVILLVDMPPRGYKDDIITVRGGFADNYLLPNGLAEIASRSNRAKRTERLERTKHQEKKAESKAMHLAEELGVTELVLPVKTNEKGSVFGSVTPREICQGLQEKGYAVQERCVAMEQPIQELGMYKVRLNLYREIHVVLTLRVVQAA